MLSDDFARMLQPIPPDTFFSEYWEQRPLIISREEADYYSHLFSIHDVDAVIHFCKPKASAIQLCKNGKSFPWNPLNEDNYSIRELYNEYYKGNTIILNSLQHSWKPLSNFYRSLESIFNHCVHVNMYMTPKNSQGFPPHFDTHEVFILQIEGSKLWRIYDIFQLFPLPIGQKPPISKDKLGEPLHEVTLNAGDMLYIPSGYVHEALTAECSSLHLTVGINVYRWVDLLSTALTLVSERNVSFRKSLPVGFLRRSDIIESLKYQFEELLQILLSSAKVEDAVERLTERVIEEMPPLPDGHFTQIDKVNSIGLDTVVQKREGVICNIVRGQDSVSIQFPGNKVRGPKYIEPALHFIAGSIEFTVRSLPDSLTDNGKLVLVRRLVREGLLAVVHESLQNQRCNSLERAW